MNASTFVLEHRPSPGNVAVSTPRGELYWHEGAAIPEPSFKGNADRAEDESTEEPPDKDDASAAGLMLPDAAVSAWAGSQALCLLPQPSKLQSDLAVLPRSPGEGAREGSVDLLRPFSDMSANNFRDIMPDALPWARLNRVPVRGDQIVELCFGGSRQRTELLCCLVAVKDVFVTPPPDSPGNTYHGQPCKLGYDAYVEEKGPATHVDASIDLQPLLVAETAWQRQQEAQQKHDQVELLYAQLQELTQQKHAEEARARRHAQDVQRAKLEFEEATRKLRAAESEVWQRQEEQRREEEEERLRREEEQARRIEEEVEKRIQDKVQAELHRRLAAEERRLRDAEEDRRRQEALEAERKRILEEDVRRTYAREVEAQRASGKGRDFCDVF
ncbi:unnamed protein product, partial [Symbiodinium microadriaticum]